MSRFINPAPQYKPYSKLYFFESNTNTQLATYADSIETIPNTHPVIADADGRVPNIFFSVVAKLVVLDESDVQYIERDPVGGDSATGGGLGAWSETTVYGISDIVKGSDNKIYVSITAGNVSNDPTITPTAWEEVRFIGVWNTNVSYAIGDVVQTLNGDLWKAVIVTIADDPSVDTGTNWLPAVSGDKIPEVIELSVLNSWEIPETADFTGANNESRQIDASANTVDITLPVLVAGDSFVYHNQITSTFKVQILNPIETIKGTEGDIAAGTNLELEAGNSVQLVAKSATVLSVVGALL